MGVSESFHVFENEMLFTFKIILQKASKVIFSHTVT